MDSLSPLRSPFAISTRALVWIGFYGVIIVAWVYLFMSHPVNANGLTDTWLGRIAALCIPASDASPVNLFGMWILMVAAMMLPTFAAALKVFDQLSSTGATSGAGMAALIGGYGIVWAGFSVIGVIAQMTLSDLGLVAQSGASLSFGLTASLLLIAGLYQFSSFKEACLSKCQQPLTFFMQHWRPGSVAAFGMGLRLGAYCLGCCWALMALGFIGGTMNLVWMGAATLFMTFEKMPAIGRPLTTLAGGACLSGAIIFAAKAMLII